MTVPFRALTLQKAKPKPKEGRGMPGLTEGGGSSWALKHILFPPHPQIQMLGIQTLKAQVHH